MSLTVALHRGVQHNPDATYSVYAGRTVTYAQTRDRVSSIAGGLRQLGAQPEDRVAILALNSDTYLQALLAIAWADAVVVPVNTRWSLPEIAHSLNESAARADRR